MAVLRVILLAALLGLCLGKKRYDGYKVLRITPGDDFQLRSIADLKRGLETRVDFWAEPTHVGKSVDLMVAPDDADSVQEFLAQHGLESTVTINDVQKVIEETSPERPEENLAALSNFRYDLYHSLGEILTWMSDVAGEYPNIAKTENIGSSYEGRDLTLLKLGKSGSNKPIFWLMSGTHAREWLSPATLLKMVDLLLTGYGSDSEITNLLDKVDFYWMPIANPDGYEYSRSSDRLWRKTRGKTSSSWCTGADPNRNWDDHWDDPASSTYACGQTYRGLAPFSEACVDVVSKYLLGLTGVEVFIDMHAYSQFWMTPYGWTTSLPSNYQAQKNLADSAMAALKAVNGLSFQTGSIANVIYVAPGSSADWAYSKANIPYCFAPELRDTGNYGFLMPEQYIYSSAMEVFAAIKVIGNHIIP
ncbi:carboxypeptidase B-like [Patiria miniata]|uniref:Peptidase M14 domain-containing protein n=1 Tax=Patiria miniata TaxID=46514 RepID=A0A914A809_PATMI|nr:carboxypeptidase B-like [Patiria miniata]